VPWPPAVSPSTRTWTPLVCLGVAAAALIAAGSAGRADPPAPVVRAAVTPDDSAAPVASAARAVRVDSDASTWSSCAAPSVLRLHAADDARDEKALAGCAKGDPWARVMDRDQALAGRCDQAPPVEPARVLEGALPLDPATAAHVRAVFRNGQAFGRRADAFGLVGDSMTIDGNFLRPLRPVYEAAQAGGPAAALLAGPGGATGDRTVVIPRELERLLGLGRLAPDAFTAPRAAKIGQHATWALTQHYVDKPTPLEEMVAAVSPAYAVVLYGANDALLRTDSVDLLTRDFDAALSNIVDALEARGIVPILTTIPKHMRERGWPDCTPSGGNNERFALHATALSADVADLACRRHLPLIDLRWSLEPLAWHGIGPDGVHLSGTRAGAGALDAKGLACGHNAQNLVTLRELARVVDAATW